MPFLVRCLPNPQTTTPRDDVEQLGKEEEPSTPSSVVFDWRRHCVDNQEQRSIGGIVFFVRQKKKQPAT
jgi:hypothetical protein